MRRKYRHGIRFFADGDEGGSGGGKVELDMKDPKVEAAIRELAKEAIGKFNAAQAKLEATITQYETAKAEAEKKAKQVTRPQHTRPDPEEQGRRWVDDNLANLQDEEDFTPQQSKKLLHLIRGTAGELVASQKAEIAKINKAHQEELEKVRNDLKTYTDDPVRIFRDTENENPKLGDGETHFGDLPSEIRQEALAAIRDGKIDTDPVTAAEIIAGRKSLKHVVSTETQKLADAEAAEGIHVGGGGAPVVELDPTDQPLPAELDTADWEDFKSLARST
jgi:hypothetical protein